MGVRTAIVGAGGHMGRRYLKILSDLGDAELVALVDVDDEAAGRLSEAYRIPAFGTVDELLAAVDDLDAAVVATPDQLHREASEKLAAGGVHLLVEKPLATSLEDAKAIAGAAERAGVKLLVGHGLRFDPRYVQAFEAVRSGEIGDVVYLNARRNDLLASPYRLGGRTESVFFVGVHDIDFALWLIGAPCTSVYAAAASNRLRELGVHDVLIGNLHFDSGQFALMEHAWILPDAMGKSDWKLEVVGTEGVIFIDGFYTGLEIYSGAGVRRPDTHIVPELYGSLRGALREEVVHFLDCVNGTADLRIRPDEAVEAVAVAVALLEAAETRTTIAVTH
jgi:predicted dehydrogenase